MNESRGASSGPWITLGIGLGLALVFIAWLIGASMLRVLALVFVGALSLATVIGASSLPIRAYRKNDSPPVVERHYHHDGTRTVVEKTIDGRPVEGPKLFQMPSAPQSMYPALLSAAWQAGHLQPRSELPVEAELNETPADEWARSWGGGR